MERALLELAEQVGEDASDELWEAAAWDAGQLVEINAVITTFIKVGARRRRIGRLRSVLFTRPVRAPGAA
jgi:hypothetical protein